MNVRPRILAVSLQLLAVLFACACSSDPQRRPPATHFDSNNSGAAPSWLEPSQAQEDVGGQGGESATEACFDIDECKRERSPCDPIHGVCTNTWGGYACHCAEGSVGDGVFCKATADCQADSCGSEGECLETQEEAGFRCVCPLGLAGPRCERDTICALDQPLNDPAAPLIDDSALETALLALVEKAPGEILRVGDLTGHYALAVPPPESDAETISSLDGLQCWTSLNELSLPGHEVESLEPLRELNFLLKLNLDCNPIASFAPLNDHVLLEELQLSTSSSCPHPLPQDATENLQGLVGLRQLSVERSLLTPAVLENLRQLQTGSAESTEENGLSCP